MIIHWNCNSITFKRHSINTHYTIQSIHPFLFHTNINYLHEYKIPCKHFGVLMQIQCGKAILRMGHIPRLDRRAA